MTEGLLFRSRSRFEIVEQPCVNKWSIKCPLSVPPNPIPLLPPSRGEPFAYFLSQSHPCSPSRVIPVLQVRSFHCPSLSGPLPCPKKRRQQAKSRRGRVRSLFWQRWSYLAHSIISKVLGRRRAQEAHRVQQIHANRDGTSEGGRTGPESPRQVSRRLPRVLKVD